MVKLASWTVGHQIYRLSSAYGTDFAIKVKVISWSRSSQVHSHFMVKVMLESNANVFRFLSQSGQLAFVRMLILLVEKQIIFIFRNWFVLFVDNITVMISINKDKFVKQESQ